MHGGPSIFIFFSFDNLGLDKVGNAWPPKGGVKTREMRGFVWIVSVGMYEFQSVIIA